MMRNNVRRAHFREHQVARHLEQAVAQIEEPGPEAVNGLAEAELGRELQLGEGEVVAIEIGHDVGGEQDRQDAPADLAIGRAPFRLLAMRRARLHRSPSPAPSLCRRKLLSSAGILIQDSQLLF
jgi:hypothetical protein